MPTQLPGRPLDAQFMGWVSCHLASQITGGRAAARRSLPIQTQRKLEAVNDGQIRRTYCGE